MKKSHILATSYDKDQVKSATLYFLVYTDIKTILEMLFFILEMKSL